MQVVDIIRIGEMKLPPAFEVAAFLKTEGIDSKSEFVDTSKVQKPDFFKKSGFLAKLVVVVR
jgi:hypothetical protein